MNRLLHHAFGLLLLGSAGAVAAEPDARMLDAAARIDYGWMTADPALIDAAATDPALAGSDPWSDYLRAYAAFRSAQMLAGQADAEGMHLADCIEAAGSAAAESVTEVEATVLIAACSALAATAQPLRSVLHQRRQRQAIQFLAAAAPDNPRFLLIAVQYGYAGVGGPAPSPSLLLSAFRANAALDAFPAWGEAEALTLSAQTRFELGDIRAARDLIEEALLIAPDFERALQLSGQITAANAAD